MTTKQFVEKGNRVSKRKKLLHEKKKAGGNSNVEILNGKVINERKKCAVEKGRKRHVKETFVKERRNICMRGRRMNKNARKEKIIIWERRK